MTAIVWKGAFRASHEEEHDQPPAHLLDTSGFAATDTIIVQEIPDGITIPQDVGELLKRERFLFAPFLKEALEKCATMIALLYSSTGASPKLVTEAKKFAIRATKFSGADALSIQTQRFVDSLQVIGSVLAGELTAEQTKNPAKPAKSMTLENAISAFSSFKTIATLKDDAQKKLKDKYNVFQGVADVLDAIAMPANTPRRTMLGIDRGNLANIYRYVFLAMLYLLDGDITNAQLNNNFAYSAAVYWAQLFQQATPTPQQNTKPQPQYTKPQPPPQTVYTKPPAPQKK